MSEEDSDKAIERWNELLETVSEEEAEWIGQFEEHGNEIATDLFFLDDFVSRQLVIPTMGACHQMEKLLIKMRKSRVATD